MRSRAVAVLLGLLLVGTVGCSFRVGSAETATSWQEKSDQALASAVSGLGTAELLLKNRREGRVTRSYAVVGIRDALTTLDTEASAYFALQPPASSTTDDRRVVGALTDSLEVLTAASVAISGPDPVARRQAEQECQDAAAAVQELQDEIAKSG